jgi:hypothetical protein
MRIEISLLGRTVTESGAVLFLFDDGTGREYCSETDALSDASIDPTRVQNVLRDLLVSIGQTSSNQIPVTAIYDDADPQGNIVRVAL